MKIFVLGSGYVGMALLTHLKDRNHTLYVSTTRNDKIDTLRSLTEHVYVVKGSDKHALKEVMDLCDAVIVLVAPKNHEQYEETYLNTAKAISEVLTQRHRPLYLLYTSSTGVYENSQNEWCSEDDSIQPKSDNAKILAETERLYLNDENPFVKTCILRLGGIYGPNRTLEQRALRLSGKEMPGTGDEPTNHIHLNDIVLAIDHALSNQLEGIYNLVNDSHPLKRQLYSSLCNAQGIEPPSWQGNITVRYKVSNTKIKQTGFVFVHPIF